MDSTRRAQSNGGCGGRMAERVAALVEVLTADCEARAAGGALLTQAGAEHVRLLVEMARRGVTAPVPAPAPPRPRWDAMGRRLWLGDRLLKEFRQPAQNQTALLAAVEARGWAAGHAADPLPAEDGETDRQAQDRLHETIRSLNHGLPANTVHFRGDGTGHGVRWEVGASANGSGTGRRP